MARERTRAAKAKSMAISVSKHITLTAVCAATLVVGKLALAFIPNIEVVTTLIVVYAFVFGYDSIGAVLVFCLLDVIIYPPSLDVAISYFLYWPALAGAVIFMKKLGVKSELAYTVAAVVMTLLFGVLTTFVSHIVIGVPFLATYLAGIPFYVAQVISALVFMSVAFKPLTRALTKVRGAAFGTSAEKLKNVADRTK